MCKTTWHPHIYNVCEHVMYMMWKVPRSPTCGSAIHSLYSHYNISSREATLHRHTDRSGNSAVSFSGGIGCCIKSNCHHWGEEEMVDLRHNEAVLYRLHEVHAEKSSHIYVPELTIIILNDDTSGWWVQSDSTVPCCQRHSERLGTLHHSITSDGYHHSLVCTASIECQVHGHSCVVRWS